MILQVESCKDTMIVDNDSINGIFNRFLLKFIIYLQGLEFENQKSKRRCLYFAWKD